MTHFNHGGTHNERRGFHKTPVRTRSSEKENMSRIFTHFVKGEEGEDPKECHLNERGEIVDGPLEIRIRDRKILEGGREYTFRQYVEAQKRVCKERGEGFFYNLILERERVVRMRIKTKEKVGTKGKYIISGSSSYKKRGN